MITDKELQFLHDKAVTNAAVNSGAVHVGKTVATTPAVLVLTGKDLAGGTGLSVAVKTAASADMSGAVTLGTFAADLQASPLLQVKIPYGVKEYLQVTVTPTGTFTAGTVSVDVSYGPELQAI